MIKKSTFLTNRHIPVLASTALLAGLAYWTITKSDSSVAVVKTDATSGHSQQDLRHGSSEKSEVATRNEVSSALRQAFSTTSADVLTSIHFADAEALWEGVKISSVSLLSRKAELLSLGDVVELNVGGARPLAAKVILKDIVADSDTLSLGLDVEGGEMKAHLFVKSSGEVSGTIGAKMAPVVYKLTGSGASLTLQRKLASDDACLAVADAKASATAGFPVHPSKAKPPVPNNKPVGRADIPVLNSYIGATGVLYLDMDGETVSGTRWNTFFTDGKPIVATPPNYTADQVREAWQIVSEDYRPFNVNVTTDLAVFNSYPVNRRMRIIFTENWQWFDAAGGVAYLNSFSDGSGDPCWVFTPLIGDQNGAGQAASHEGGHTFGLNHDGRKTPKEEYYLGNGAWAPVMGAGYGTPIVQWSKGEYPEASNTEDDLAIISSTSNGVGYRDDDYGNTIEKASGLGSPAANTVSSTGIIERTGDVDVFAFSTTGGAANLVIAPSSPVNAQNLNVKATLYDANGVSVISQSPTTDTGATIATTLNPGIFYLAIEGDANGTWATGGYGNYGSLGSYTITGNVAGLGGAVAKITSPIPEQLSLIEGNGLYLTGAIEGGGTGQTIKWSQKSSPNGGKAVFSSTNQLDSRVVFTKTGIYQIEFSVNYKGIKSSDVVTVSVESAVDAKIYSNRGPEIEIVDPRNPELNIVDSEEVIPVVDTNLLLRGRAKDDGVPLEKLPSLTWEIGQGNANILNPNAPISTVQFAPANPELKDDDVIVVLSSSDSLIRTFKQVSFKCVIESKSVINKTSTAKAFVPTSGSLGTSWYAKDFNDSSWQTGRLGAGYHLASLYNVFIGENLNFAAELYKKASSLYVRSNFTLAEGREVKSAKLRIRYDDGFVAYLNGVEIASKNMPQEIKWDSVANTDRVSSDKVSSSTGYVPAAMTTPTDIVLTASQIANIVTGTNVLAFQVSNYSKNDRELLIQPELVLDTVPVIAAPTSIATSAAALTATSGEEAVSTTIPGPGQLNLPALIQAADPVGTPARIVSPVLDSVSVVIGNGLYLSANSTDGLANQLIKWSVRTSPADGKAVFSDSKLNQTRVTFSKVGTYQIDLSINYNGVMTTDSLIVSVEEATDDKKYLDRGPDLMLTRVGLTDVTEDLTREIEVESYETVVTGRATDADESTLPTLQWQVASADPLSKTTVTNTSASAAMVKFVEPDRALLILSAADASMRTFKSVPIRCTLSSESVVNHKTPSLAWVPTKADNDRTWYLPTFNAESSWISGKLGAGFHLNELYNVYISPEFNLRNALYKKSSSLYVRSSFSLADSKTVTGARLKVRYDDGFVAYLNGIEIARRNMPDGSPNWKTLASTDRVRSVYTNTTSGFVPAVLADPTEIDLTEHLDRFVTGQNVLAIQVCNSSLTDRELLIQPELIVDTRGAEITPLPIVYYVTGSSIAADEAAKKDSDGDGLSDQFEKAVTRTDVNTSQINLKSAKVSYKDAAVRGDYAGLVFENGKGAIAQQSVTLSNTGAFSAKIEGLNFGGTFRGTLVADTINRIPIKTMKGVTAATVSLNVQPDGQMSISGQLWNDLTEVGFFELRRVAFDKAKKMYATSMSLSASAAQDAVGPKEDVKGNCKISQQGLTLITAVLPDGSRVTQSTNVLNGNAIPLFLRASPARRSPVLLAGILAFDGIPGASNISGNVRLLNFGGMYSDPYPTGYDQLRLMIGSAN